MTDYDVVVAGDGPAALALTAACAATGLRVCAVGEGVPWAATYGTWVDEVPAFVDALGAVSPIDVAVADRRIALDRTYGVFDNALLRARFADAPVLVGRVGGVRHHAWGTLVDTTTGPLRARLVVDATGAVPVLLSPRRAVVQVPQQTAYGLVLGHRPEAVGGIGSVLMDWRQPPGAVGPPTFLYVLALPGGRWLVEETSLARAEPVGSAVLRERLTARLGTDLTDRAEHVEHVSIPMAPGLPNRGQAVVGFGAAAGYIHPATGYSVAASLRAAPRVADGLARAVGLDDPRRRALAAWNAVWPAEYRRARTLHDYGLGVLLRMSADELSGFFGAFFDLPTEQWGAYLRVDTSAAAVSRTMTAMFRSVPWHLRRRLLPR
jgi:lycopene beta-cyclase